MVLNSKQRQTGQDNYNDAVRITRRQMLTGTLTVPTVAGFYFGYDKMDSEPVRVGIIGTGNQGNAHIGSINPDYLQVVAFSDIRPTNQERAWRNLYALHGEGAKTIKMYTDYHDLLKDDRVEMVIIALPLHLHAPATIAALEAGKHVLCEKLMAKTVGECKSMVRAADKANLLLAIGHQRHYSYLYHNCLSLINREDKAILGDIKHIRAYWHRNQVIKGDGWRPDVPVEDLDFFKQNPEVLSKGGYDSVEQLVRWRLYDKTGGGLIVELGSHQLDACSIFLGKVHPKSVQGVGVKSWFTDDRDIDDHIFLTYEFPNDVVVMYSSISTNAFDGYGEEVMGTKGTLIVEQENDAYVFKEGEAKDTRVSWAEARLSRPTVDSGSTTQWVSTVGKPDTLTSRGYREEQEHMAYLIRHEELWKGLPPDQAQLPRCHGRVAMADAVIALVSNLAMAGNKRIEFKPDWFDVALDSVPETEV